MSHLVKDTFKEALDSNLDLTEMTNQNFEVRFLEARDKAQFLTLEMNAIFANLRKSEMALNLEFKVEILNANQQINQVFFYILEKFKMADFYLVNFLLMIIIAICKNLKSCNHHLVSKNFNLKKTAYSISLKNFPHK